MMAELAIMAVLAAAGYLFQLAVAPRLDATARMWMSFPAGAFLCMVVALVWLHTTGRVDPAAALTLIGTGALLAALWTARGRGWNRSELLRMGLLLATTAAAVITNRVVHLTRLTEDSMQYLSLSIEYQVDQALTSAPALPLLARQFGLPSLHSLSALTDELYLASLGSLFGLSTVGLLSWVAWTSSEGRVRRTWLVLAGVVFVIASNRFLYAWFYVNTHVQVAAYLLVSLVGAWMALTRREPQWALATGLGLGALLLLRPDSPLFVAIVLVVLASLAPTVRTAMLAAVPPVVISLGWHGGVLLRHSEHAGEISLASPVFVSILVVIGAATAVASSQWRGTREIAGYYDRILLAGLAVALIAGAISEPAVLTDSLRAAAINTVAGFWLTTWWVVLSLGLVALFVHRIPISRIWTSSMIGFCLLFWLLPYFRGGGWRVGPGDSGVRILIHLLPIAVAFLLLAATSTGTTEPELAAESVESPNHETRHLSSSH